MVYDACNVCGDTGYYQDGNKFVCINCDVVMNKLTLGFPGGCNPIPLEHNKDDAITITVDDLIVEKDTFTS